MDAEENLAGQKQCNTCSNTKERVPLPNRMNFWKNFQKGGGVIFNPKIYAADFGNF